MAEQVIQVDIQAKDKSSKAFEDASKGSDKLTKKLKGLLGVTRDLTIVGAGATKIIGTFGKAFTVPLRAAELQQKASINLAQVLVGRLDKGARTAMKGLQAFANATQQNIGISNQQAESFLAQALAFDSISIDQAKSLVTIAAAWEQVDDQGRKAVTAFEQLLPLFSGLSTAAPTLGVALDATKNRTRELDRATEFLFRRYVDTAKVMNTTAAGAFNRLQLTVGDFVESIGLAIGRTDTFHNIVNLLSGGISGLGDKLFISGDAVEVLDKILQAVIVGAIRFAKALLTIVGVMGPLIAKAARFFGVLDGGSQSAKAAQASYEALRTELDTKLKKAWDDGAISAQEFNAAMDRGGGGARTSSKAIEDLRDELNEARASMDALSSSVLDAEGLAESMSPLVTMLDTLEHNLTKSAEGARSLGDILEEIFSDTEPIQFFDPDALAFMEEGADAFVEQFVRMHEEGKIELEGLFGFLEESALTIGDAFFEITDAISSSFGDMLVDFEDKTVSASEAWKKFGESVKKNALKSFGNALGKIILAPLNMFLDLIVKAITKLIAEAVGLQAFDAAARAQTLIQTTSLAEAILAVMSPAATAAAIATLGAANAFGFAAQAQIQASRITGAAEGAVILPGPGGSLLQVGEAGQRELVTPLPQGSLAAEFARPGSANSLGGLGGGLLVENINIDRVDASDPDDVEALLEVLSERLLEDFRGTFAG